MCVELLLGLATFKKYSSLILCVAMGMKSIVGVAGGATRAAITQHQVKTKQLFCGAGGEEISILRPRKFLRVAIFRKTGKSQGIWLSKEKSGNLAKQGKVREFDETGKSWGIRLSREKSGNLIRQGKVKEFG